jgi:hypothetical protein
MINKNISPLIILATLALASCAGPESYQDKMSRYNPQNSGKNQVPEIRTANFKFAQAETKIKGRGPASVGTETKPNIEADKEGNPTNKKLYFLSLYTEYETLKNYSTEFVGPEISICPNFHTSLLNHKEKRSETPKTAYLSKKFTYDSARLSEEGYVSAHPELLLPLSKDSVTPKVVDVIKSSKETMTDFAINELVHKALDIHLAKTYSEVRELCEYGVSDNYYIYENLITHIKSNKFEADSNNMNTLLKTTLFSNMALMTSLEKYQPAPARSGRSIASVSDEGKKGPYVNEVMARLNVTWANQYFDYIKESR